MKRSTLLWLFFLVTIHSAMSQGKWPDKAACGGNEIEIGDNGNSNLCYSWKATPADPAVVNLTSAKIKIKPTQTATYTRTSVGNAFSSRVTDGVKVFVVNDVTFSEQTSQKYGFDNWTDPAIPWKSVENGKSDPIKVKITPANGYEGVYFKVNSLFGLFKDVEVSPVHATSDQFDLNITGIDDGEDEVDANCEKEDGEKIKEFNVKSANLKTKTVAVRLVHETNYNSADLNISDADLINQLNKVYYNQAIFQWTVIRLPAMRVHFDLNNDRMIDVSDGWTSPEMDVVINNCKDDSYDHNLFIVSNPSDGSLGFMEYNQRYGFVHADISNHHANTVAHELGHGAFGLVHPDQHGDNDIENLMHSDLPSPKRLRKKQWDKINP